MTPVYGMEDLDSSLKHLPDQTLELATKAMARVTMLVEGVLKTYPASTAANEPGRTTAKGKPLGYYERNRGEWYPIKNKPANFSGKFGKGLGIVKARRAQKKQGVYAYKLIPSSEQLGKSWNAHVTVNQGAVIGVVGTDVSYAAPVQGPDQVDIFATIGWPTIDQAVDEVNPDAALREELANLTF